MDVPWIANLNDPWILNSLSVGVFMEQLKIIVGCLTSG
jgi:hypothetical protein